MMKKRFLIPAVISCCAVLFTCGPRIVQNARWKLTIESVKYVHGFQMNVRFYDGVRVEFRLQYLGADGPIRLPKINLLNSKNERIKAAVASGDADSYAFAVWYEDAKEIPLTGNQELSRNPMALLFDVPKNETYRLAFDKEPPIPISF